jgi:hypothetical protein
MTAAAVEVAAPADAAPVAAGDAVGAPPTGSETVKLRRPARGVRRRSRAGRRARPVAAKPATVDVITRVGQQLWQLPVYVDGRLAGRSPLLELTLPPGEHLVEVRDPRFEVVRRPVGVRSGERKRVTIQLRRRRN